ncbi:MAG: membrane lipoprotein lipid attachment site-containing protein [Pseudomonadota bacterium]|nr:membrane lipoprotein lipid attachment site-containing protein [Pseudomonadota bacterium]|tara:strand:+ start:187 stop:468 length:282 start_codon:yes stop_codon:yes gene_type:complete
MKKILLPISLIVMVSGCASNPSALSDEAKSDEEEGEKICRLEKVLGTKIPEKYCYTKEELEHLQEVSEKTFEKEQRLRERQRIQEGLGTLNPD